MAKVSKKFIIRLKLDQLPAYQLAQKAGLNPNTLYKITSGIVPIQDKDPRVIAVGHLLNLQAEECFEEEPTQVATVSAGVPA